MYCLSVSSNTSAGLNTHSTVSGESIRYYHVMLVGIICFLIGAIMSFVILIHCQQRITPTLHLDHKPTTAAAAAAAAGSLATADKRRDVMVTSRGGVATLETVIRRASIDEKISRTNDSNDIFSSAGTGRANGASQSALVHLRQYYRRHYTHGVADRTYSRS